MKRALKRAVIGFFLLWLSSSILMSVYYRVTFWDGAELIYAKVAPKLGWNIGHYEMRNIRVVDELGRPVAPEGADRKSVV